MKTPVITKRKVNVDITDEVMSFIAKIMGVSIAFIGVWAVACLVSAWISVGPMQMLRGYITAITGY